MFSITSEPCPATSALAFSVASSTPAATEISFSICGLLAAGGASEINNSFAHIFCSGDGRLCSLSAMSAVFALSLLSCIAVSIAA